MMSLPLGFQNVARRERIFSASLAMMLLEHEPGAPAGHIPPVKEWTQLTKQMGINGKWTQSRVLMAFHIKVHYLQGYPCFFQGLAVV